MNQNSRSGGFKGSGLTSPVPRGFGGGKKNKRLYAFCAWESQELLLNVCIGLSGGGYGGVVRGTDDRPEEVPAKTLSIKLSS